MKYILGVDGGNTKTDYFLFDVNGNFVGSYRDGTCSHEGLSDSFEGTYRVMKKAFDAFLPKYNVKIDDIASACFGLAGDDVPSQQAHLEEVIKRLGFKKFVVVNDSMLGIKAGTTNGYGACSINGTGTCAGGIGIDGKVLQIGGIGEITGDEGGGRFLSRKVVRAVYDEAFRFGEHTSLTDIVFRGLNITSKFQLSEAISEVFFKRSFDYNMFTVACFEEANKGDKVAIKLLTDMGECLARAAAGCVKNLNMGTIPEVVLIGSVYVKGACPVLVESFKKKVNELLNINCKFNVLQVPPATGAIIWAKELYDNHFPSFEERQNIIDTISKVLNK